MRRRCGIRAHAIAEVPVERIRIQRPRIREIETVIETDVVATVNDDPAAFSAACAVGENAL